MEPMSDLLVFDPSTPVDDDISLNFKIDEGKYNTYKSIEGESTDDLDIDSSIDGMLIDIEPTKDGKKYEVTETFPKLACFSEFDDSDVLEFHGSLIQIQSQKLTGAKRRRYAILFQNKFVVFKKPEEKVSKFQIPIDKINLIISNDSPSSFVKSDTFKFRLETPVKTYKFVCQTQELFNEWIRNFKKLKSNSSSIRPTVILKDNILLNDVKSYRIFTIDENFFISYYESDECFENNIAMHRIKLKSSGVKKDVNDHNTIHLITSYREYVLTFDTSKQCDQWFNKVSELIHKAISQTSLSKFAKTGSNVLSELCFNPSNKKCVECGGEPEWASISLFITLCSQCSGYHRGLGPNISVRGIFLDETTWEDKTIIKLFQQIGNDNSEKLWFANQPESFEINQKFISDKYIKKKYMKKIDMDKDEMCKKMLEYILSDDIIKIMTFFHNGVDLNYVHPIEKISPYSLAENHKKETILKYFDRQGKLSSRDWRKGLFTEEFYKRNISNYIGRTFNCIFNKENTIHISLLIELRYFKLIDTMKNVEICKVRFEDICFMSKKEETCDIIYLLLVIKDTKMSINDDIKEDINYLGIFKNENDYGADIQDLKNILAQKICPYFETKTSFTCMSWVLLSSVEQDWAPYMLILQSNRIIHFHDPINLNNSASFSLDIRKIQKIEELKDSNYEGSCPFQAYNFASVCLCSSIIYHIRSETKSVHEELLITLKKSWEIRDYNLSNQILNNNDVPLAVHKMIEYLQNTATTIEGPFRRGGRVCESEKIYKRLVSDPNSYILTDQNPYDVASALKMFFRQLDDPLLTKKLYKKWSKVPLMEENEKLHNYKEILSELPKVNYATLRRLIFLLVHIIDNSHLTQMNPDNMSTSFSTCFLISGSDQFSFNNTDLSILPFLIRNFTELFDVSEKEKKTEDQIKFAILKLNDIPPQSSMIRQIYIHPDINHLLLTNLAYDKEVIQSVEFFCKFSPIKPQWTVTNLKGVFFQENTFDEILLFEEKKIEEYKMQKLIYPQENLLKAIEMSETAEVKSKLLNSSKKFIFKPNKRNISLTVTENSKTFGIEAYFSTSSKNKVYIEISDTNLLNIWKNVFRDDIISSVSIKSLNIYRSVLDGKNIIAFEDLKSEDKKSAMLKVVQYFKIKSRSFYCFINIPKQSDYESFMMYYDQAKVFELTPIKERPGIAKILV